VVVLSARVAIWGNPLYLLLERTDSHVLQKADQIALEKRPPDGDGEVAFLRSFSRLTLLELGVFVLELALLVTLWVRGTMPNLSVGLLFKNLLMVLVSAGMARGNTDDKGMFESLRALPPWLVLGDRLSALISAAGCLLLFLTVNQLNWW
jgi:hypothetical protein